MDNVNNIQAALSATGFVFCIAGVFGIALGSGYKIFGLAWTSGVILALGVLFFLACAWVPVFA